MGHDQSRCTIFSCEPVENAVRYQLLFGSTSDRVMDYNVTSETPTPPNQTLSTCPRKTPGGLSSLRSIRFINLCRSEIDQTAENRPPVANAGPQVVYAGLDGRATLTLDGSKSSDRTETRWSLLGLGHRRKCYISLESARLLTYP